MSTKSPDADVKHAAEEQETSFAETAFKLAGKSADEARRTGAIDRADDQVERLFSRSTRRSTARCIGRCGIGTSRSSCSARRRSPRRRMCKR
jgi:hypothetical protein